MPRRLGQHFLIRSAVLERIAQAACPRPANLVIEIGAGRGALTQYLLARASRIVAIELDTRLAAHLEQRFRGEARLEIVSGDVLKTDLTQWGRATVAGNLPYYITSPVIERILAMGSSLERAVLLVQKEVAARLTATPGTRAYGFLTVQTKLHATPEMLFRVPSSAFRPPPKVDSALVRFTPHPSPVTDAAGFLRFAGHCFRHKRKTLRNNLVPIYGKEALQELPEASQRAEQLSLEQFHDLYFRLSQTLRS